MSQKAVAELYGNCFQIISQYERRAYQLLKAKNRIQNAAEFYGYTCSMAYGGTLGFFKQKGTSTTEFMAIKNIERKEKINKINELLDDMIWEV